MNIPSLIRKFLNGETTVEEERQLKDYFHSHPATEAECDFQDMFAYFEADMPMDDRLSQELNAGEEPAGTPAPPTTARRLHALPFWLAAGCVAAVVLVFFLRPQQPPRNSGSQTAETMVAVVDSSGTRTAPTVPSDSATVSPQDTRPTPHARRRYRVAEPRPSYCATNATATQTLDSVLHTSERKVETQLLRQDLQQALTQEIITAMLDRQEAVSQLILANMPDADEEEYIVSY